MNGFAPEHEAKIEARRKSLDPAVIEAAQREWPTLMSDVAAEMKRGTAPTDPRVKALAARWLELLELFTGGDAGITKTLRHQHETKANEQYQAKADQHYQAKVDSGEHVGPSAEMIAYISQAQKAVG